MRWAGRAANGARCRYDRCGEGLVGKLEAVCVLADLGNLDPALACVATCDTGGGFALAAAQLLHKHLEPTHGCSPADKNVPVCHLPLVARRDSSVLSLNLWAELALSPWTSKALGFVSEAVSSWILSAFG